VAKSSEAEKARRVNATINLLKQRTSSRILSEIIARYGLSRRQAYRYLHQAQRAASPLPIPDQKAVFTVKLPRTLITQVRRQAGRQRSPISAWVERALRVGLEQSKSHG